MVLRHALKQLYTQVHHQIPEQCICSCCHICICCYRPPDAPVPWIPYVVIWLSGCDGQLVSMSDSQPQDRGFESCQKPVGSSKPSRVGYGWRQWCLGSLSRKWVPGYRQRWQLYLDYPWRLEACERVYTPPGSWAGDRCNRSARGNNM